MLTLLGNLCGAYTSYEAKPATHFRSGLTNCFYIGSVGKLCLFFSAEFDSPGVLEIVEPSEDDETRETTALENESKKIRRKGMKVNKKTTLFESWVTRSDIFRTLKSSCDISTKRKEVVDLYDINTQ